MLAKGKDAILSYTTTLGRVQLTGRSSCTGHFTQSSTSKKDVGVRWEMDILAEEGKRALIERVGCHYNLVSAHSLGWHHPVKLHS